MAKWQSTNNMKVESRNWWDKGLTPDAELTQWQRQKRVLKAASEKQRAYVLTLVALDRALPKVPLRVTMTRIAPRAFNDDNLVGAFKHVRDGIAQGLHTTDENPGIEWVCAQERGKPREYGVRIEIEEVD